MTSTGDTGTTGNLGEQTTTEENGSVIVPLPTVIAVVVVGVLCGVAGLVYVLYKFTRWRKSQANYEEIEGTKKNLSFFGGKSSENSSKCKSIFLTVAAKFPSRNKHDDLSPILSVKREEEELDTSPEDSSIVEASPCQSPNLARRAGGNKLANLEASSSIGGINPELYKDLDEDSTFYSDKHIGRLWFCLEYEHEAERLRITLIKGRNLPNRSMGNANQCDPMVKIFLLPDERRHLQSKVKRKTTNPNFNEEFVFQVTFKALQERTLRLSVYDIDRSKKHKIIGHIVVPLKDLDLGFNEKIEMWRDLEKETTISETTSELGELNFSLMYNPTLERVTIVVFSGRGLKLQDNYPNDSYVKVGLMSNSKIVKSKKTSVVKRNLNPTFNESVHFKLAGDNLDMTSISLTVFQQAPAVKGDRTVGRVVVGPFMYARGKELEHWNDMLSHQKEAIASWHHLS